jgi:endonuclease-3
MSFGVIVKKLGDYYKGRVSMLGSFSNEDPFFVLISTILSARNTDESTAPIAKRLLKKYNTPHRLANASIKDLEKMVFSTGFFRIKAKRIKDASQYIMDEFDGRVPHTMEELTLIPGVGKKTAGCVIVYAHGKDEIPVDIHVQVISQRLDWTSYSWQGNLFD